MEFVPQDIEDVVLVRPKIYKDRRGFFLETYRKSLFTEFGIETEFVQDNLSSSVRGTIRGLHYQVENEQAKLVMVPEGEIFDVAVDIRKGSPTFGKHTFAVLSSNNRYSMYIPVGFAHGFAVLSDSALVSYKCSDYYNPDAERGIRWNDPELGIDWKVDEPVVSAKDRRQPMLKEVTGRDLFEY